MEVWFEITAIICNQNKMKKFINNTMYLSMKETTVLIPKESPGEHFTMLS